VFRECGRGEDDKTNNNNSVALVCEQTIPTERPLLVGEVSADRGCHEVSVTDTYGRILGFLDRSRYFRGDDNCDT
jgi:hypothetical protein